jgi:hypothetical protein
MLSGEGWDIKLFEEGQHVTIFQGNDSNLSSFPALGMLSVLL